MDPVAVVGGGPAGISCAIWLKRLGLEPVIFDRGRLGGQLHDITLPLQDVPGLGTIAAGALAARLEEQLRSLHIPVKEGKEAVSFDSGSSTLGCKDGTSYPVSAVAYAPGLRTRQLAVPGREEITRLSTSDLIRERIDGLIVVVGGGDRAFEAAIRLTDAGQSVILVHRRAHFRARPDFQTQAERRRFPVYVNATVRSVRAGAQGIEVTIERGGRQQRVAARCVLARIGMEPDIQPGLCPEALSDVVPLWTPVGIRVLGDAVSPVPFRSIATAFGSGMVAAKELVMTLSRTP